MVTAGRRGGRGGGGGAGLLESRGIKREAAPSPLVGFHSDELPRRLPADPPMFDAASDQYTQLGATPPRLRTYITDARGKNSQRHQFQCQFDAHISRTESHKRCVIVVRWAPDPCLIHVCVHHWNFVFITSHASVYTGRVSLLNTSLFSNCALKVQCVRYGMIYDY